MQARSDGSLATASMFGGCDCFCSKSEAADSVYTEIVF